ncbi:MAG: VOC family protein [Deltaproteobacteria bacterium]|nr:VOC family protein [Deltaproteobacteria bacterium]
MESPLKVSGIDHVVFHVKELSRAKKFYVDFLGMEVDHESSWQCFLKCGRQGVALFEVEDNEEVHGGSEVNHIAGKRRHRSPRPSGRSALHLFSRSRRPSTAAADAEGVNGSEPDVQRRC